MTARPSPELARLSNALAGQYLVERELGRGGMGVVLLARDLRLDRLVAIKTLPYHMAEDPAIRERFLREARTAAALSHARIVPIHHADEAGDTVYFVMGFVDGGSLAQHAHSAERLTPEQVTRMMVDVADALDYAHAHGVVHRDIKAENILLDATTGRAMVTDFGIARVAEAAPTTATGNILGTVHYMSPEQVSGERLDGRSDLYALGVLAFLLLAGRFPFEHEAPSAVLVAHVTKRPPRLREVAPEVPAELADVVDRLLRKDPAERFATAEELMDALRRLNATDSAPYAAPRRSRAVAKTPAAPAIPARLSSAEANEVWERAAALQQLTGAMAPPPIPPRVADEPSRAAASRTEGYRMADVLAAAQEAGIDRPYVERALAERLPVTPGAVSAGVVRPGAAMLVKPSPWLGARTRLEYESVVEGEVSADDLAELTLELRTIFDEFGSVSTVGRTLTFTSSAASPARGSARRLQVTIASRGGRTTIRAFEDLRQTAYGIVGGVSGGVGGGLGGAMAGVIIGLTQNPLFALPAMLGIAGLAFGISRLGVSRWSARKDRDLHAAVERLAARVGELSADEG
ncbi:MAG: serine/threonine-protein kinase [Gemmatimonadaceae bacterium]